ncbi:hypothetical protein A0256_10505 [Mucilaginibacter sp. PAMC 26640]|nr:hypothetical protein A0256_10505 [Mucilaginibacter sp. PAMC 26640]
MIASTERRVITLATGKAIYVEMAVNLARSFMWWHQTSDIKFCLFTDQPELIPADVKDHIDIGILKPGELGTGFSAKLHLDKLAKEGQTLFIDSDCLIYGDLTTVFDRFKGKQVSVAGSYVSSGEWFGDVAAICKKFHVPHLPKFNGGIYYLEKSVETDKVYQTARELEQQYDEIGFVRLRSRPNDEVLMALAMQLNDQSPVADDGSILGEFVNFASGVKADVLAGIAKLYNTPNDKAYNSEWPLTIGNPLVIHYLGHHTRLLPYMKEAKQLKYFYADKKSVATAKRLTFLQVTLPVKSRLLLTNILRPVFRSLFGTRQIKKSERIVD